MTVQFCDISEWVMITIYHSGGLTKNDRLTDNSEIGFLVGQLNWSFNTHTILAPQDTFHWGPHFITLR